jgi:hypothetical protein
MALKKGDHLSKVEFCTGNDNLAMAGRKRHHPCGKGKGSLSRFALQPQTIDYQEAMDQQFGMNFTAPCYVNFCPILDIHPDFLRRKSNSATFQGETYLSLEMLGSRSRVSTR